MLLAFVDSIAGFSLVGLGFALYEAGRVQRLAGWSAQVGLCAAKRLMRYSFHDPWIRRLFLLSRRWWSMLALLLGSKKALV